MYALYKVYGTFMLCKCSKRFTCVSFIAALFVVYLCQIGGVAYLHDLYPW